MPSLSCLQALDIKKLTFGRHQTFSLRFTWLSKGFQALQANPDIFNDDQATVILGVGKNMVESIKYWLQATRMIEAKTLTPTALGNALFGETGYDLYLEDEGTLWLIHWQLVSNPRLASSFFWFFNQYHQPQFNSDELLQNLSRFIQDNGIKASINTLKKETSLITRMYIASKGSKHIPVEDALDSPLSLLDLIHLDDVTKLYRSPAIQRPDLPYAIVGYALTELFEAYQNTAISLPDLLYGHAGFPALGGTFRLSETGLLTKLEELVLNFPDDFELRESAGLHQLHRLKNNIKPLDLLKKYYQQQDWKQPE